MLTPPEDLDDATLVRALRDGWGLEVAGLEYRAVGFGAHHWEVGDTGGGRWFVTVADLRGRRVRGGESLELGFERLLGSLRAAAALREDFVVAPVLRRDGEPLGWVGDAFAVAVQPWVVGESFGWDDYTVEHRAAMLDLVVAVHGAPAAVRGLAPVEDFAIPSREAFGWAGRVEAGPYARRAAESVRGSALPEALDRYDEVVAAVRRDLPEFVLTHGEPHPGNTMRADGRWLLIDWESAMAAPPERDLWHLETGYEAYTAATGRVLRPEVLELYRLRWDLGEVAVGLARFAEPHGDTADDQETYANLAESLEAITSSGFRSR